jgi:hypothetical protein
MPARCQFKPGIDDEILAILTTEPTKTGIIARRCKTASKGAVIHHMHRLAKNGRIVREQIKSKRSIVGRSFVWSLK